MSLALFCTQGMYMASGSKMISSIKMPMVHDAMRPALFATPLPNYYSIDIKWIIYFNKYKLYI